MLLFLFIVGVVNPEITKEFHVFNMHNVKNYMYTFNTYVLYS